VDLDRLLNPRTIAFVGGRHAELAVAQCDALGYEGEIWPVHPTRETVAGRPAFRSVADLPGPPDAAFVAVNRRETVEVVTELAKLGAGGAVCYASGFAEAGPEGQALQQQLVDHDMPVIGPNCYGTINTTSGAALWPDVQGCRRLEGRRGAALVTQSGNIALNLTMNTRGLDFTHVISLGNQAGVRIEDCIAALAADPAIAAIGIHAEAIVDSIAFAAAARQAHSKGTPLVMLKTGITETSAAIAVSHTAAVAKPADVYQALFDRYGVITVDSVNDLAAVLSFLVTIGPLPGNRMVSLSCSGGEASLVADRGIAHGIDFAAFDHDQVTRIGATLSDLVAITNPLDYHTFIWDDEAKLTACFTASLDGPADAALLVMDWPTRGGDAGSWYPAVEAIVAARSATDTPTVVAASLPENMPAELRDRLQQAGIATAYSIDEALLAAAAAAAAGRWLADPAPPLHDAAATMHIATSVLDEAAAKRLLGEAGIVIPRGYRRSIDGVERDEAAPSRLRYPVVAKAAGVAHKSDVGGVVIGIGNDVELAAALDQLRGLGNNVLIEEQVTDAVAELLVTVRREPPIGNVLVLGSGGTLVELVGDTVTALLPLEPAAITSLIDRLQIGKLLAGHRGHSAADRSAIIDVVSRLATMLSSSPEIVEIEINPLMATPRSAVAVDALITVAIEETSHD
jgi:acetyl-CoA synthetase